MGIVLGPNQYGKAEVRLVRVDRDTDRHRIHDLSVSSQLRGDFDAAHVEGDQRGVLPTDSQKNTILSFAKEEGIAAIEDFALTLADHFVSSADSVHAARVAIDEYAWGRIPVGDDGHDHSFVRSGQDVRTTVVNVAGTGPDREAWVVSGLKDLVILKSTGSQFKGYLKDKYTTLEEADDRILATSLVARWRYARRDVDWDTAYDAIKHTMLATFANVYSHALQHSLYEMGKAVLSAHDEVAEIRFSAPNKHHFLVDLAPFGVDNPGEVFHAADRPYGLIEATVTRDDAPDPGLAWQTVPGFH